MAIFGAYGVVYLCRLTHLMTDDVEKVWYLCMNITTKLIMLMLFSGIRSSGSQNTRCHSISISLYLYFYIYYIYISIYIGVCIMLGISFIDLGIGKYHDLIVNMLVNTHFSFRRQVAVMDSEQGNAESAARRQISKVLTFEELYKHLIE